jgi:hypothetical protein
MIISKNILKDLKGNEIFKIGHKILSQTSTPQFYPVGDICFVDCPGVQDQKKVNEYPNQTAVHWI